MQRLLYKSKTLHDYLLQFCKAWYEAKEQTGVLQVQLTQTLPFVIVGIEQERSAYWGSTEQGSYYQSYARVADNPNFASNPLPLPSPSTAVTTSGASVTSTTTPPPEPSNATEMPLDASASPLNGKKHTKNLKGDLTSLLAPKT